MKIPHVIFDVDEHNYLYDRYSNEFLCVNDALKGVCNEKSVVTPELQHLCKQYDVLKPNEITKFSLSAIYDTKTKIAKKLYNEINQLVFITTEDCNLRCKYCIYSGCYKNMRGHNSNHKLTIDVAKKAIDYFLENSNNKFDKTIAFYGGEALTEFNMIKKIVEYAKSINIGIRFAMNTNLTLLTRDILLFLVENEFLLTVSLDGPKEIHDLYRVTKNQKPTQELVVRNLLMIKKYDEEYYNKHIIINTLIVPHSFDFSIVDNFFSIDLFSGLPIESFIVLMLNPRDNDFVKRYDYENFYRGFYAYSSQKVIDAHVSGRTVFSDMRISYNTFIKGIKKIYYREMNRLNEYSFYWPNGICIPGLRSLLVTSDGTFYPCETLYDLKEFKVGDIENGFDIDGITNKVNEYIKYANHLCKDCWAYRFCSHCYYSAMQNDKYNIESKRANCCMMKANIIKEFKMFFQIYTKNPNAFNYLDDGEAERMYGHMIND